mmetsp:Transcript_12297/g.40350  ORF Transcript_12297/g.40350 Transcript_12297/m.40350 type:complete len:310 (+) Transcript_12297:64-993(+)
MESNDSTRPIVEDLERQRDALVAAFEAQSSSYSDLERELVEVRGERDELRLTIEEDEKEIQGVVEEFERLLSEAEKRAELAEKRAEAADARVQQLLLAAADAAVAKRALGLGSDSFASEDTEGSSPGTPQGPTMQAPDMRILRPSSLAPALATEQLPPPPSLPPSLPPVVATTAEEAVGGDGPSTPTTSVGQAVFERRRQRHAASEERARIAAHRLGTSARGRTGSVADSLIADLVASAAAAAAGGSSSPAAAGAVAVAPAPVAAPMRSRNDWSTELLRMELVKRGAPLPANCSRAGLLASLSATAAEQ